jgi:hypothetical protein
MAGMEITTNTETYEDRERYRKQCEVAKAKSKACGKGSKDKGKKGKGKGKKSELDEAEECAEERAGRSARGHRSQRGSGNGRNGLPTGRNSLHMSQLQSLSHLSPPMRLLGCCVLRWLGSAKRWRQVLAQCRQARQVAARRHHLQR